MVCRRNRRQPSNHRRLRPRHQETRVAKRPVVEIPAGAIRTARSARWRSALYGQARQRVERRLRHLEIGGVPLDTDGKVADRLGRGESRAAARERIADDAGAERQRRTHDAPEKPLRLEGRIAASRSRPRAGEHGITSRNGSSSETRLRPPVPQRRRLAATVPANGLRKIPHGSQHERGITVTLRNSASAPFGRSPPRSVCTSRMTSPRFRNPAAWKAWNVVVDSSGLDATNMWPPEDMARANSPKKRCRRSVSRSDSTVNRGSGRRFAPSHEGGMRHTPPRPARLGVIVVVVLLYRHHRVNRVLRQRVEPGGRVREDAGRPLRQVRARLGAVPPSDRHRSPADSRSSSIHDDARLSSWRGALGKFRHRCPPG